MFEFFDRKEEFIVREGSLPHWYQPGVTYFVTFRAEDSVPQNLLRAWHSRQADWLQRHEIDPRSPGWKSDLQAHPDLEREFHRKFTREFMAYLDRGYGECVLGDARCAQLVANSLMHFDGDRYQLGDFVVMPNHVHVLCCLLEQTAIEPLCRSWKQFAAAKINKRLARRGRFWQAESFDHLGRGPDQFDYLRRYIAENPLKAGLHAGEYLHWMRPE